jgi:hypothetical protein
MNHNCQRSLCETPHYEDDTENFIECPDHGEYPIELAQCLICLCIDNEVETDEASEA